MNTSVSLEHHRHAHAAPDTKDSVRLEALRKGRCPTHPQIKIQEYKWSKGGLYGPVTPCPMCIKDEHMKHAVYMQTTTPTSGPATPPGFSPLTAGKVMEDLDLDFNPFEKMGFRPSLVRKLILGGIEDAVMLESISSKEKLNLVEELNFNYGEKLAFKQYFNLLDREEVVEGYEESINVEGFKKMGFRPALIQKLVTGGIEDAGLLKSIPPKEKLNLMTKLGFNYGEKIVFKQYFNLFEDAHEEEEIEPEEVDPYADLPSFTSAQVRESIRLQQKLLLKNPKLTQDTKRSLRRHKEYVEELLLQPNCWAVMVLGAFAGTSDFICSYHCTPTLSPQKSDLSIIVRKKVNGRYIEEASHLSHPNYGYDPDFNAGPPMVMNFMNVLTLDVHCRLVDGKRDMYCVKQFGAKKMTMSVGACDTGFYTCQCVGSGVDLDTMTISAPFRCSWATASWGDNCQIL